MMAAMCLSIFLLLFFLDMGIKQYIEDTFKDNEERKTMVPRVVFRKVYNKGFAFSVLDRYPEIVQGASVFAGAGILLYDVWLFLTKKKKIRKIGMTLITAGALSNICDRLIREKVIDYVGVKCKNSFLSRITANFADLYILVGMILVSISNVARKKKHKKKKNID